MIEADPPLSMHKVRSRRIEDTDVPGVVDLLTRGFERHPRGFWERVLGGLSFGVPEAAYNPPPLGNFSDRELFEKQTQILKRIASQEDCVVVGWAGVFMLPRHRGMFTVFCHAPKSFRVRGPGLKAPRRVVPSRPRDRNCDPSPAGRTPR